MIDRHKEVARAWYSAHWAHVNAMLRENGPQVEPSLEDAGNPELWKPMHWRWFMVGEVARWVGVKV